MPSTTNILTHLGEMPVETFLSDYWQQQPLLLRNAFTNFPTIDPEELAGFSLEEDVESRILLETPKTDPLQSQWQLLNGPFDLNTFEQLPKDHWTLLVQAVDQLHPDIHALLQQFRFIPNWRVDDIMVSYATNGGSVGPHFDYYDVFLLQAHGRRRWRLGQQCTASSPLRTDTECKILTQFHAVEEWTVEPGDLLYIPPNLAHWGVADEECVTYSIGFRAPSHGDILLDYSQDLAANLSADQRFTDAGRTFNVDSGQIRQEDIQRVVDILKPMLTDEIALRDWFGRYMTQKRRESPQFEVPQNSHSVRLAAGSRAAYFAVKQNQAILYINGEQFECDPAFAQQVCNYQAIELDSLELAERELVHRFIDNEWLL